MTESSLEKQKIAEKVAEINAYWQSHVAANNQQFGRLSADGFSRLGGTTQDLPQLLIEQAQYLRNMGKRAYWEEREDRCRSQNSRARHDTATLFPLPLPNGGYPAEGEFPGTLGEFMSLEGPALTALLALYELPPQDQAVDARNILARYFHIQL